MGIIKAFLENDKYKNLGCIGSSSGSLAAIFYKTNANNIDIITDRLKQYLSDLHNKGWIYWFFNFWRKVYCLSSYVVDQFELEGYSLSCLKDTHILHLGLFPFGPVFTSKWNSYQDLKYNLSASQSLPFLQDHPRIFRWLPVLDGCLHQIQPLLPTSTKTNTLTVSCCYGMRKSDISPSKEINKYWFVQIPQPDRFEYLYNMGYEDGKKYILDSYKIESMV
jgi:hypothetical protein